MNIISYSLWGTNPKYLIGAIKNVELAKQIFPDWKCRFYVDDLVPLSIIIQLEDLGAEVIEVNDIGDFRGMFWRMRAVNDADVVLIRDCDSRLSWREKKCIDEWLFGAKYDIMSIKDHPFHRPYCVMPGLMGFRKTEIDFNKLVEDFLKKDWNNDFYGVDYWFYQGIWSMIEKRTLIFGERSWTWGNPGNMEIPIKRDGLEFCGKVFDENDQTVLEHELALKRWLNG